jgi:hypothetical protein
MRDGSHNLIVIFERSRGRIVARTGSISPVRHLAFSPDRAKIAVVHFVNDVFLIDSATGQRTVDLNIFGVNHEAAYDRVGRLAITSSDGKIRLYDSDLKLLASAPAPGGKRPHGIAFSPDGARLAVGYADTTAVDVLDATTLGRLLRPIRRSGQRQFGDGSRGRQTGAALLAAGWWHVRGEVRARRWGGGGRGAHTADLPLARNAVTGLRGLAGGRLAFAAQDPRLGVLEADGREAWACEPATADFRGQEDLLAVSVDGARVAFGYKTGALTATFLLAEQRLAAGLVATGLTTARTATPGLAAKGLDELGCRRSPATRRILRP